MHSIRPYLLALLAVPCVSLAGDTLVSSGHAGWRYWDEGERPPEGWTAPTFDDAAWDEGKAPLGYGEKDVATEISFGEHENNKHAAAYFRLQFEVEDPKAQAQWLAELRCDDGAAVYLNGQEVYRYNMPIGDLTGAKFAAGKLSSAGNRESRFHPFVLTPDELQAGENVLAISVHQADAGSSDLVMDVSISARDAAQVEAPAKKSLVKDGMLESDKDIGDYINRWGKHLHLQNRAPNPNRWASQLGREFLIPPLDPVPGSEEPLSPAQLYERCAPSVLILSGISEAKEFAPSHAGAFIISADGLALTNHHVINSLSQADHIVATTLDGRVVSVLEIVGSSEADDIALIQLEGGGFQPVPLATSAGVGTDLVAITHPRASFYTLTKGQLGRYCREDGRPRIMVTTEFARGSSGAPIFNPHGAVVGMVEMTRSIAYDTLPLHLDEETLKVGRGERGSRLFLSMNHQMTLRYAIPWQSIRAFLEN